MRADFQNIIQARNHKETICSWEWNLWTFCIYKKLFLLRTVFISDNGDRTDWLDTQYGILGKTWNGLDIHFLFLHGEVELKWKISR